MITVTLSSDLSSSNGDVCSTCGSHICVDCSLGVYVDDHMSWVR